MTISVQNKFFHMLEIKGYGSISESKSRVYLKGAEVLAEAPTLNLEKTLSSNPRNILIYKGSLFCEEIEPYPSHDYFGQ